MATFMVQGISWKVDSCSAYQEFLRFYGTRNFVTLFAKALYCFISWASWIQSIPYFPQIYFMLILWHWDHQNCITYWFR